MLIIRPEVPLVECIEQFCAKWGGEDERSQKFETEEWRKRNKNEVKIRSNLESKKATAK